MHPGFHLWFCQIWNQTKLPLFLALVSSISKAAKREPATLPDLAIAQAPLGSWEVDMCRGGGGMDLLKLVVLDFLGASKRKWIQMMVSTRIFWEYIFGRFSKNLEKPRKNILRRIKPRAWKHLGTALNCPAILLREMTKIRPNLVIFVTLWGTPLFWAHALLAGLDTTGCSHSHNAFSFDFLWNPV